MSTPETAVIIRAKNEEEWIGTVLKKLTDQTYQNFEIILVDSGSTDRTLEVARQYPVKIVEILPEDFTYPSAINVGINTSSATSYLVILSAHSLPINNEWLQSGIEVMRNNPKAMGVYGPLLALPKTTLSDKLIHGASYLVNYIKTWPKRRRIIKEPGMGVLGFTNALIRKDLWEQYPINESFAGGGEDGDWAEYWFNKDYVAIKDLGFTVRHSHNLGPIAWYKQIMHWRGVAKATEFEHMDYRKDAAHKT